MGNHCLSYLISHFDTYPLQYLSLKCTIALPGKWFCNTKIPFCLLGHVRNEWCHSTNVTLHSRGGSRISQTGRIVWSPMKGTNLTFGNFFPENCITMKKVHVFNCSFKLKPYLISFSCFNDDLLLLILFNGRLWTQIPDSKFWGLKIDQLHILKVSCLKTLRE